MDPAVFNIDVREVNVYDYCDYEGRGLLLQALQQTGDKGLEHEVSLLASLMYSDGEGMRLTTSDGAREDETEAEARSLCWKLEYRGFYGETLLHILLICNSDLHTRIAKCLLQRFPQLAHDIFQSQEYYGRCLQSDEMLFSRSSLLPQHVC